jgi:hypothetical protein
VLVLLAMTHAGLAQSPDLPRTTEDALHQMSRRAAVIFTGQVVAVRRQGENRAARTVEVDFAIEDAVRGVNGGTYTLREWAGLWLAGEQPFRVGQRFLMLLHAPGAARLSSPVGGMDGAIPIRGGAAAGGATSDTRAAPAGNGRVVDLRWISARVVRPVTYQAEWTARPTAIPVAVHSDALLEAEPGQPPAKLTQSADYTAMLATLRGWEKVDHAAR